MDTLDSSFYPNSELELKVKIDSLMNQWAERCSNSDDFSSDGFYPYYTMQRYRILFVGRESRGLGGRDYIKVLHHAYKGFDGKGQTIGGRPMNCLAFHRKMFYLSYGILKNFPDFYSIPKPSKLAINFATESGISFSFMEVSKSSNPKDEDFRSNWYSIGSSIKKAIDTNRNYIREEIELLSPDIIIGSGVYNLHEIIQHNNIKVLDKNVVLLSNLSRKNTLYCSTYHFSCYKNSDFSLYKWMETVFNRFRNQLDDINEHK